MPRRQLIAWLLAVAALLVAAPTAVLAIYHSNRFYRLQVVPGWVPLVCLIATAALLVLSSRKGWRRTWVWFVAAAVLASELVPVLGLTMAWAAFGSDDRAVVTVAISADGRHDVVTHNVNAVIDTLCGVRLRERDGLFGRQAEVWTAPEGERCPKSVSFTGNTTIRIVDARGREITVHFDADRMQLTQLVPPL
ncbi:hypothetical protein [Nocardia sp. NPDC057030]|uniref:hypothetical protein n=1 Tax=unclassified Nocardia TaxID=2637762 RepID=UPI00362BC570